jgi:Methylamine utilisation protein MauE
MNDHHEHDQLLMNCTIKSFLPLIIIIAAIVSFTLLRQVRYGFNLDDAMYDFMGSFFVIFGFFKVINLHGFVEAYSTYDIIAKHSIAYAYIYPFIELGLGIAYLLRYQLVIATWITLLVMIVSSIGVAYELAQKKQIVCACLGAMFKIPMTYVTLAEDLLMSIMALIMLIKYYFL